MEIEEDVDDVAEVQAFMGQLAQAIGMNVHGLHVTEGGGGVGPGIAQEEE